ncbi:MAG: cysteine methyltransferase [Deltaproteobacteria bacterium]|nr:cysteine methyltransferase [Deltaproteobacteria bacterium]HCH63962.1 cysteine methyltransferase [Deltaproteobacteria bacterium]
MWATHFPSPLGRLRLVCTEQALVGVYFPDHAPPPAHQAEDGAHPLLDAAATQLAEWFDARRTQFELPLAHTGTPFQQTVWTALRSIDHGQTTTYGALAMRLGRPSAARAIGAAVGRNPLSIIVPCHRVMGRGGRLTGYAGGLWRKRWLLAHESSGGLLFEQR